MIQHKIKKFTESQKIAVLLMQERIELEKKAFQDRMVVLQQEWKDLVLVLGEEHGIDKMSEESTKWHLTEKKDGFEYRD